MNYKFRNCDCKDINYILELKRLGLKWYIEIIYGWDDLIQREKTLEELEEHKDDMKIITLNNKDIGVTTFYEEDDVYVIGLTIIHPDYQNKGIATSILSNYIDITKNNHKRITIKTYKDNPARVLYKRLGFEIYDTDDTHIYMEIVFNKMGV